MLKPSMQDLLKQVGNRYLLVNLAAQRARDIVEEAEESETKLDEKPVQMALDEISAGKVLYRPGPKTEAVAVKNHAIAMAMLDVDDDDEEELEAIDAMDDTIGFVLEDDDEDVEEVEDIDDGAPVEDDYGSDDMPIEDQ